MPSVGILSVMTCLAREETRTTEEWSLTVLWYLVPVQLSIYTLNWNWNNMTVDNATCQPSVILTDQSHRFFLKWRIQSRTWHLFTFFNNLTSFWNSHLFLNFFFLFTKGFSKISKGKICLLLLLLAVQRNYSLVWKPCLLPHLLPNICWVLLVK